MINIQDIKEVVLIAGCLGDITADQQHKAKNFFYYYCYAAIIFREPKIFFFFLFINIKQKGSERVTIPFKNRSRFPFSFFPFFFLLSDLFKTEFAIRWMRREEGENEEEEEEEGTENFIARYFIFFRSLASSFSARIRDLFTFEGFSHPFSVLQNPPFSFVFFFFFS